MPDLTAPHARVLPFDVAAVRRDFPILAAAAGTRALVYLDNASTTQKPRAVIDRLMAFYAGENANVHRGVYELSERATAAYEAARATVARFLNAASTSEIVFVRGTTEAVNLVAATHGRAHLAAGSEVLITAMEHHSNLVPWQRVCEETGARLRVAPVTPEGELDLAALEALLSESTRMVAVAHVSNALGTVNPVRAIVELAHRRRIPVLVDGAQAVAHLPVDVQALGCDFYAFSGHKVFGPTGIGVLYGRLDLLEAMPPYQSGGDMIRSVAFEHTCYNDVPYKFEAGTPHVAGVVGLAAAIQYLSSFDTERVVEHENDVLRYATEQLSSLPHVRLVGRAAAKAGVLSFLVDDVHPHDVATVLDRAGVAVRAGHHCCQPLMDRFGLPGTVRASFALYNTRADADALAAAVRAACERFA